MSFFPEPTEASQTMNAFLLHAAGRTAGQSTGGAARLSGVPEHGARLSAALNDLESAERSKDPDLIHYAEHKLDQVVQDARKARLERAEQNRPRNPDGTFATFDGGSHGRRGVAPGPAGMIQ